MARKLDYKACRKLIYELSTNTYDKLYIDELLNLNNCNLKDFTEGIARQAFKIKNISSLLHANKLKTDIQKNRLTSYEYELLLSVNNFSCSEEALFEINKYIRKKELLKKYKDLFEAAQIEATQSAKIDSYSIDFAKMLNNRKELSNYSIQLRKSLENELLLLESETYKADE